MSVVLALVSAAMFGVGDFFGGLAARRVHPFLVGLAAHAMAIGPLAVLSVFVAAPTLSGRDLALGALGGAFGGVGVLFLFHGLAHGRMTVVAPITAVVAAGLPVLAGLAFGERPSVLQLVGVATALAAIVLISQESPADHPTAGTEPGAPLVLDHEAVAGHAHASAPHGGAATGVLAAAFLAGVGFGVFYVALGRTSDDAGLWPLVSGRAASLSLFTLLVVRRPALRAGFRRPGRPVAALIGVAAALDVAANTAYLLAVRDGLLSIVPVLSSLYPAGTVVLARFVLRERLRGVQLSGLTLAGAAVALVAGG